jgi:hypothetical protein
MALVIPIKSERDCDGCTKCCDGWLTGIAHGHKFHHGKPCAFKGSSGCMIYDYRPYDPCVTFKCFWKYNNLVPIKFKPDKIGVILVERNIDGHRFLDVNLGGKLPSIELLEWVEDMYNKQKIKNIRVFLGESLYVYSKDPVIVNYATEKYKDYNLVIK